LWSPLFASLGGLFIAYVTYGRRAPAMLNWEASGGLLWTFLQRKWYFDEIYDAILVKPARWIARQLWLRGDRDGIDRVGPNGAAHAAVAATKQIIRLQTGYLYHYAFVMLIGLVALATFLLVRGGL
jgi:NADH-quinone oxidoreductase subunit L